jgi:hypothetical protein
MNRGPAAIIPFEKRLFGLGLRLQLLDLPALLLNLLLLRLYLRLRLRVRIFIVLHRIADDEAGPGTKRAADRGTSAWSADGRTDYRASARADEGSNTGPLLARAERLAGAPGEGHEHRTRNQNRY